jgi:hypothetical protein
MSGCTKTNGTDSRQIDDTPPITVPHAADITLPTAAASAVLRSVEEIHKGGVTVGTANAITTGGTPMAWILSDLVRFSDQAAAKPLFDAFHSLFPAEAEAKSAVDWQSMTDFLIAKDLPAPPRYRGFKSELFLSIDRRWESIFTDFDADIDWRFLSWGGVFIDRRALGDKTPCANGCIPANDDPAVTTAAKGAWYPDDAIIFGITVGNESVALPKNIMEVHEMVNMTLGGRRMAIPYCTLCGSAEAFYTDKVVGAKRPLVLRTSGLLYLSNKVMFDLDTGSAFDTFNGRAVSGDLHLEKVSLPQETVVNSTWGAWKHKHPTTKIVAEDGGWGERYPLDPLNGRDAGGPIFPIRRADSRLSVHTQIVGATNSTGTAVAFPVDQVRASIETGKTVEMAGLTVKSDASGFIVLERGKQIPSHQSFWFAWAQFKPGTKLWSAG